jgi:probable HAF family extracellular repeat protein
MSVSVRIAVGALLSASAVASGAEAATLYTTAKIPTSASELKIVALNDYTHAVGTLGDPNSSSSVVIYNWSANGGSVNDPGKVITPLQPDATVMVAKGINDLSEVIGYAAIADATGQPDLKHRRAFLYDDYTGKYTDINQPPIRTSGGADFDSEATGINNSGDVVGDFLNRTQHPGDPNAHGFLYSHGGVTDIGSLAGKGTYPSAIGDSGEVTGNSIAAYSPGGGLKDHTFIYEHGAMTDLNIDSVIPNIGDIGLDANGQDKILGNATTSTGVHVCFIYSSGVVTKMTAASDPKYQSPRDCEMHKMNNQGVAVGHMFFDSVAASMNGAFVYSDGKVERLDNLISPDDPAAVDKVHFTDAVAINDRGEIVAKAGDTYYLLTPVADTGSATPPPTPTPTPTPSPAPSPTPPPTVGPVAPVTPAPTPIVTPVQPAPAPASSPTPTPTQSPDPSASGTTTPSTSTPPPATSAADAPAPATPKSGGGAMDLLFLSMFGTAVALRRRFGR